MSNRYVDIYDDYLAHYGVKGMKWGVRRYQNADGSLKSAGKRRYGGRLLGGAASNKTAKNKKTRRGEKGSLLKKRKKLSPAQKAERRKVREKKIGAALNTMADGLEKTSYAMAERRKVDAWFKAFDSTAKSVNNPAVGSLYNHTRAAVGRSVYKNAYREYEEKLRKERKK